MFDRVRHQTKPGVPRVIVEGAPPSGQHIFRKNLNIPPWNPVILAEHDLTLHGSKEINYQFGQPEA